jgi:hypothetical protein
VISRPYRTAERDIVAKPEAECAGPLQEPFARVQSDLLKFRQPSRRLEAAVEETREALEARRRARAARIEHTGTI